MSTVKYRTKKGVVHRVNHEFPDEGDRRFVPECNKGSVWEGDRVPDDQDVTCVICAPTSFTEGIEFEIIPDGNGGGTINRASS